MRPAHYEKPHISPHTAAAAVERRAIFMTESYQDAARFVPLNFLAHAYVLASSLGFPSSLPSISKAPSSPNSSCHGAYRLFTIDKMPHDSFSPAQTAEAVVAGAIARTKQNQAIIFFKAFNAGIFLSLGATVSTIVAGGSSGLNASNPGLVKVIAAALSLPLGLMSVSSAPHGPYNLLCRH